MVYQRDYEPSSAAMIRSLFINKQALEKGAVRPAEVADQSVKKLEFWVRG